MKPFNLEEFKSGKKAVTRDGKIATFGGYNPEAHKLHSVVGWVGVYTQSWMDNGLWREERKSDLDLIGMAPEKKTVWVKVFKTGVDGSYMVTNGYSTKEMLDKVYNGTDVDDYICTTSFEIEV